jgi:hypothetical protein
MFAVKRRLDIGTHLQTAAKSPSYFGITASAEAATASVASIKSASRAVRRSAPGKQSGPSVRPIHVECVSQKNTRAEKYSQSRDDFDHGFAPWLEIPGRAA